MKGVQGFWKPRKVGKGVDLYPSIVRKGAKFTVVVTAVPDTPKHVTLRFPCTPTGEQDQLVAQLTAQMELANHVIRSHRWCGCGNRTQMMTLKRKPFVRFVCIDDEGTKSCGKHVDVPEHLHRRLAPMLSAVKR